MFDIEPRNVADILSGSLACPSDRDFIKEILRGLIFSYLKKIAKLLTTAVALRIPNLILDKVFP